MTMRSRKRDRLVQDRTGPPARAWCNLEHLELSTLDWVDWYNQRRLHSWCGNIPPASTKPATTINIKVRVQRPECRNRSLHQTAGHLSPGSPGPSSTTPTLATVT